MYGISLDSLQTTRFYSSNGGNYGLASPHIETNGLLHLLSWLKDYLSYRVTIFIDCANLINSIQVSATTPTSISWTICQIREIANTIQ